MEIDASAATTVLDYLDDEVTVQPVWRHPATEIARTHAGLLGWEYTKADIEDARQGEDTTFGNATDIARTESASSNSSRRFRPTNRPGRRPSARRCSG
ncbi:MAG: hypothetical protein ABEJ57_05260 [Halobacteriaceae archaeon]